MSKLELVQIFRSIQHLFNIQTSLNAKHDKFVVPKIGDYQSQVAGFYEIRIDKAFSYATTVLLSVRMELSAVYVVWTSAKPFSFGY